MKRLEPLWLLLLVIGGVSWAWIALFDTNLLSEIFGSGTLLDVVYCVIGFAALAMLPALWSHVHVGGIHRPHAPAS